MSFGGAPPPPRPPAPPPPPPPGLTEEEEARLRRQRSDLRATSRVTRASLRIDPAVLAAAGPLPAQTQPGTTGIRIG